MHDPRLNRRHFLVGSTALAALGTSGLLAACGGDSPDRILGSAFENGLATAGFVVTGMRQRAPLVLFEDGSPLRSGAPKSIDVTVHFAGKQISAATLTRHDAEIPTPYYPLELNLTDPGDYEVRAKFSQIPVQFRARRPDAVKLVQIGEPLRSVVTPTTANAQGVKPICTRTPEPCPLHARSLDQVMGDRTPVALLISTPGFCQTGICGPVLELLVSEAKNFPTIACVHAEVYVDPQELSTGKASPRTTAAVNTYQLSYEPSLIVANAAGKVTARLDFTWDRNELQSALKTALS